MNENRPLGEHVRFGSLDSLSQHLVTTAWDVSHRAFCFQSNFPVGSAILAENAAGETKVFHGCNVENNFFPATICAERNAGTTAVAEGYTRFSAVAVVCRKIPGGSPCGLCRQFLTQFGLDATLLCVVDHDKNVQLGTVGDLLPAATGLVLPLSDLPRTDAARVQRLLALKARSYVPYSKNPRGAIFRAANAAGSFKNFSGMACDNASYGGSIAAENVAMYAARTAGYTVSPLLSVTVSDVHSHNPIDGEVLQVLREFGKNPDIILIDDSRMLVTDLIRLLPDSFGPESL